MWLLHENGIRHALHYLDDFLILGPTNSMECLDSLQAALALCNHVGFSVAPHKTEGPASKLVFLGIEVDSESLCLRLPQEKKE